MESEPMFVDQVTPLLFESFVTVAERVMESLGSTVAEAGETVTLLGGFTHPERPKMAKDVIATNPASALSLRMARALFFPDMSFLRYINRTVGEPIFFG